MADKAPAKPEQEDIPVEAITPAAAVKAVKGTVRVFKMKDGEKVLDGKGRPVVINRALRAEDVLSCKLGDNGVITVVTVDGQKLTSQDA